MRRHDPERQAHGERHAEGDYHREVRHDRLDARESLDGGAEPAADENSRPTPGDADEHRLAEKLQQDVPPRSADRAADADLPDALQYRREHDVHDADAADDQGNGRDGTEHDVEDRLGTLLLLQQQLGHSDLEVHDRVVAAGEHALDDARPRGDELRVAYPDDHAVELVTIEAQRAPSATIATGQPRSAGSGGNGSPPASARFVGRKYVVAPPPTLPERCRPSRVIVVFKPISAQAPSTAGIARAVASASA